VSCARRIMPANGFPDIAHFVYISRQQVLKCERGLCMWQYKHITNHTLNFDCASLHRCLPDPAYASIHIFDEFNDIHMPRQKCAYCRGRVEEASGCACSGVHLYCHLQRARALDGRSCNLCDLYDHGFCNRGSPSHPTADHG